MMSRVKQRVTIGCPRSPLAPCTVSETARVCACAQLVFRYYTSIRHPPTRPRTFLLSNPQCDPNEWANMTKWTGGNDNTQHNQHNRDACVHI